MTKIEKMFYDEQVEAVNNNTKKIAINLLSDGLSVDKVCRYTGLDTSVVAELSRGNVKNLDKEVVTV